MTVMRTLQLASTITIPKLSVAGYTEDIVLFKHSDGRIFCTKSGDFSTFDRNGANKTVLYDFTANGYVGYNINGAIELPTGTVIVALTNYDDTMTFMRSTNAGYTAWEEVNTDWNGQRLYRGWAVNPAGVLMVGEYPTQASILTVRLWKVTNDGQTWTVVYTFNGRQGIEETKTIFHIHTVCYDPYDGLFWIGTGDQDPEPSVWTYDGTTMTLIGEGTQLWRATSFAFTPNYVLWGSDGNVTIDGVSKCRMVRLDKSTGAMEVLQAVDSTMFNTEIVSGRSLPTYLCCGTPNLILLSNNGREWVVSKELTLNPALPDVYSWFYNYVDNGDGRIFGYITGILREDNNQPLTHGTVILDLV